MPKLTIVLLLTILNYSYGQYKDAAYYQAVQDLFNTTQRWDGIYSGFEEVTSAKTTAIGAIDKCGQGADRGVHLCVFYYNCDGKTKTIIPSDSYDGVGQIDVRFGGNQCENYLQICCKIPPDGVIPPEVINPTTATPGREVAPPVSEQAYCGISNRNGVDFKITGNVNNEAEYGEFPWMVAILSKYYDPSKRLPLFLCGGSLIAPNVVLTGAYWVHEREVDDIIVRAGEWDTQTESERYPYQERSVANIIVHENFNNKVLFNNVALLILDQPFTSAPHIATICLPNQGMAFNSRNCFASGWGKDEFGVQGNYQVILKKIELPTVEKYQCQESLRTTRLGPYFKLDESFMCSGGESGKDTCTGDGGSPLVCPDPYNRNRYVQVGITSWGIGCGKPGIPGVYADVAYFRNWIDKKLAGLIIDNTSYIK